MATILVVDDELVNRQLLTAILGPNGHELYQAGNGREALEIAKQRLPDLTIVDLFMPQMNGTQFIRAMRADARTADLEIALYTATTQDAAMHDFMQAYGVRYVIAKPSEPQAVRDVVEAALKRR